MFYFQLNDGSKVNLNPFLIGMVVGLLMIRLAGWFTIPFWVILLPLWIIPVFMLVMFCFFYLVWMIAPKSFPKPMLERRKKTKKS